MSHEGQHTQVSEMWSSPAVDQSLIDPDCSPTKTCRNMVGISFDGMWGDDVDPAVGWKQQLERDGKLSTGGESLRDLVLGNSSS